MHRYEIGATVRLIVATRVIGMLTRPDKARGV